MYDIFVDFYNNHLKNYINNELLLDDNIKLFNIVNS